MASARLAMERAIRLIDDGRHDEARSVLSLELGKQLTPLQTVKKPVLLSPKSLMSKRISISRAGAGLASGRPLQPAAAPIPAATGRDLGPREPESETEDFFAIEKSENTLLSRRDPEPEVAPLDADWAEPTTTEPVVVVVEQPSTAVDDTSVAEAGEMLDDADSNQTLAETGPPTVDPVVITTEDEEEQEQAEPDSKKYWRRRGTADVVTAAIDQHIDDHVTRSKSRLSMTVTNPLAADGDMKEHKMYNNALKELLQTEKDYVRDLHIIISSYKEPMEKAGLVTKKESHTMFSNVGQLVGLHVELLAQMNAVMNRRRKQELSLAAAQSAEAEVEAPGQKKPMSPPPEKSGLKVLIRVLLARENANKTLVVTKKTLGKEALAQALNKHLSRLPSEEEKTRLKAYYSDCEIVHIPAAGQGSNAMEVVIETEEPMLPQIVYQLGDDLPQFVVRRSTVKPSIGHCFLELVLAPSLVGKGGPLADRRQATYLKMYSEYCSAQVASMSQVYQLRSKSKKFTAFIQVPHPPERRLLPQAI